VNKLADSLWDRARDALLAARQLLETSPDSAASRAYYAAFFAVSAHFALKGRTFRKHSAVEVAVHRDLVKRGLWLKELGAKYSALVETRSVGDYGVTERVSAEEASDAVRDAGDILQAIAAGQPGLFAGLEDT
jgi:uncharacterized protein (UPF0332 family)